MVIIYTEVYFYFTNFRPKFQSAKVVPKTYPIIEEYAIR
jgi:hypothetical protein